MAILIVEDENEIREVEKLYAEGAGFEVFEARDGAEAWEIFKEKQEEIELIVLDLNLPKIDGISLCKKFRGRSNLPIIMVTARVQESDEIQGLDIGANDYVKKPFSPKVLVARIRRLLNKSNGENILKIHNLEIDPDKMEVIKNGSIVNLTATQFNILYAMCQHPGKVFTRDEIMNRAYNSIDSGNIYDRTIDSHIKTIRKVIEDNGEPKILLTVIGKGYKIAENGK